MNEQTRMIELAGIDEGVKSWANTILKKIGGAIVKNDIKNFYNEVMKNSDYEDIVFLLNTNADWKDFQKTFNHHGFSGTEDSKNVRKLVSLLKNKHNEN